MDEGLNVGQTERVSVISDSSRHLKFENTSDPSTIKFILMKILMRELEWSIPLIGT